MTMKTIKLGKLIGVLENYLQHLHVEHSFDPPKDWLIEVDAYVMTSKEANSTTGIYITLRDPGMASIHLSHLKRALGLEDDKETNEHDFSTKD